MSERITTDLILGTLKEWVETKTPIDPNLWIEACSKLNVLKSDETAKLYELQQQKALYKTLLIENGDTVAKATAKTEASDVYKLWKMQEAKIDMIEEQIKISKIQARMGREEYKGY